ncbi:MAG: hypothetical protein MJY60_04735 [Bacteroidales bacterium]|nr:hypothetical protein [Bacteroidales bacterium]
MTLLSSVLCISATIVNFDKLWKDYESARKADRPKQQLEILEQIGKAAKASHSAWNFHRYWQENINVQTSRNWKLHDSLSKCRHAEILVFDEPVITFLDDDIDWHSRSSFAKDNENRLRNAHNTEFYSAYFGKTTAKCIHNDYEFVLWSIGERNDDSFRKMLAEHYSQEAISYFYSQDSLQRRFEALNEATSASNQYKDLYDDCLKYEAQRKSFRGEDANLMATATRVESIVETLSEKDVSFSVKEGHLKALLRNMSSATFIISRDKKEIDRHTVHNDKKSFYVWDTLYYDLPYLEDGNYVIKCKEDILDPELKYNKYSISVAQRHDARGFSVFAADYKTGKPMTDVDIILYRDDKVIETVKHISMDGFVYLPDNVQKKINLNKLFSYTLECRATDERGGARLSDKLRMAQSSIDNAPSGERCELYLDRSICKQGDSIRFKLINYNIDDDYRASTVSGSSFTVNLCDSQGKTRNSLKLKTGAMGSADGSFIIPEDSHNGRWRIYATDSRCSGSASFIVDDVVLPSYELVFDECDSIAFPGDEITVTGTIKSYSGHNLSSARITYSITGRSPDVADKLLITDASGRFKLSFAADTSQYYVGYQVMVKITDLTGETREFSTYRRSSPDFSMSLNLNNPSEGELNLDLAQPLYRRGMSILTSDKAVFAINSSYGELVIKYRLTREGRALLSGECSSSKPLTIDLAGLPQGIYTLEAVSSKGKYSCSTECTFFKMTKNDKVINDSLEHIFLPLDGDVPAFVIGTTSGPMWACVALYGPGNVPLDARLVHLDGVKGSDGSMARICFDNVKDIPHETRAYVLYFRDGQAFSWDHAFVRPAKEHLLPLDFTRMHTAAGPASSYTFLLKSRPGAEGLASVYDKAMEAFGSNRYIGINLPVPSAPYIQFARNAAAGGQSEYEAYIIAYGKSKGRAAGRVVMASKAAAPMMLDAVAANESVQTEEAVSIEDHASGVEPAVRSDFGTVLAFEPFLKADADGNMSFEVRTSDKLSTFIVQIFAHDADMNNAVTSTEMVVKVPVEVSLQQPRILYEGDRYVVKATFSNSLDRQVDGMVKVELLDGGDYKTARLISAEEDGLSIDASSQKDFEYELTVPQGIDSLGIKLSFIPQVTEEDGNNAADAIFVSVPVYPASQTITESHSALALSGADKDAIIAQLRTMFVNGPAKDAQFKEISIHDMLLEALPREVDTAAVNAVTLSGSINVAYSLDMPYEALLKKLEACRNTDGGYGWFPSMSSNAVVTALVLERLSGIADAQTELSDAVKWLDRAVLDNYSQKMWWHGIGLPQYLYVRSLYPSIEFDAGKVDAKALKAFRKCVREYLTPGRDRGLQGQIALKTRRALTLRRLSDYEAGATLAKAWGVELGTVRKLEKSMEKDIASLREYAVEHPSGGAYFPNAFMPWRGLLEGELYEHTLLHRLLGDDRICLWMMVQKETQRWGQDPAYVDALLEVLSCPENIQNTGVVTLSASWKKPFSQIEASGNGMSVTREFLRETKDKDGHVSYEGLKDGDLLNVGDKITVRYNIWNEENRSFVRLKAFRPANLMPVEQLSGPMGWRPWLLRTLNCPTPQGYRNVLPDATEYWYDVYPEEKTAVSEQFYVTQKGCFQSPAVIIESLYAPHYRANDKPSPSSSD